MDEMKTLRERDIELEKLWKQFEDLPMDPDTEKIEEPFLSFPAGTDREDIWHWFDERHSKDISVPIAVLSQSEIDRRIGKLNRA